MSRSRHAWYDPRRWPPLVVFVFVLLVVYMLSGLIASIGLRMAGSLRAWQSVMDSAAPLLLGWRVVLYGAITWLWLHRWKPRVMTRIANDKDGGLMARHKLKRLEFASAGFILVLELISVTKWLGGI
ncbi:hypothetical protein [Billgrantia ethanolica]|uniref:Uncharacterized protein n=1 Tax=Billgrantia ethanolica TaxID=2733486 RepID=A0ABS9A8Y7_9GAMM|nr:hypothetical protein [Halomonas ethanolica]MCE8005293.1 hypothetical protein [Halomonas ethanolica]